MADTKITDLGALGAAPATGDLLVLVDVSDSTMDAAGTDKKATIANLFTSPALTTPNIGTPSAGTLTSCTGLPIATGVSGLGTGVATALAVNVGSAGAPVVLDGALGTPSSGTLSSCTGYASTALTSVGEAGGTKFLREDGDGTCSWQAVPGGGDALVANPLSQFAATTSAQLRGVLSDEVGTGVALFAAADVANLGFNVVTDATGTVALVNGTHKHKIVICNHATATTVTVEDDTTGSWSDAAEVLVLQNTANGTVTVEADGTSSINGSTAFSTTTSGQYEVIALKRIGANAWICTGGSSSVSGAEITAGTIDYGLSFIVDSDSAISTGAKHRKRVPATGNIVAWYLSTDTSATITIDVWKDTSEPTNDDTITNGNEPTMTGQFASDTDLSNWTTTAVTAGDIIKINVDANDNATYFELLLVIRPT